MIGQHDDHTIGPLVKSLARSKSHLILLRESSNLELREAAYLLGHGWVVKSHEGHDLSVLVRTNYCLEYIQHLAGSTLKPDLHATLPLSYWVVEIKFGKAPTQATIKKMANRFDWNQMEDDLEHCGVTRL